MCCLSIAAVMAQTQQISGIVVDDKGEPVVGASVQATGTNTGTITDYDGLFELTIPTSVKTLTISYIGMKTMEVPVQKNMRVTLSENSEVLQEVVATGYLNVAKGSFAGSAQAVKADNIEKKNPTELSKSLAGEIAGVQVVNSSGQPGTNASIRIRGINSVFASAAPLYVVDGVTYDGDISSIDPGDIASTTILKDATATSLYGSRGANGVILITTKKGTSGEQGKIDVDVKAGANMRLLPMYDVITDPCEYLEMSWQGIYNTLRGSASSQQAAVQMTNNTLFGAKGIPETYNLWGLPASQLINGEGKFFEDAREVLPQYRNMTSWKNSIFRTGVKAEANVKISGGSEKTTYFTSFGYLKDEGYYIASDFDRFSIRSNIEYQPKKWLKGGLNLAYAYSSMNSPGQGGNMNNGFAYVNGIPPIYPVYLYNEDGTIQTDPRTGGKAYDYGIREGEGRAFGTGINPAGSLIYDKQRVTQHQVMGNARFEVKFYKDLKFEANIGMQYLGMNSSQLTNPYYGDAAGIGRIYKGQTNYFSLTATEMLHYNKTIAEHTVTAMAAHENQLTINSSMSGGMNRLANPESLEWSNAIQMASMGSSTAQQALDSYFANVQYSYDERYMVTGNYRADGSSKFAKGHRWGHFGSVGAAWNFTNESFISNNADWLKNGKLRLSWGMLGNQGVPMNLYSDQYSVEYVDGQVGYLWYYKGNSDLTWERTSQVDLGLEFSIMKYLDAEIDYYYKLTDHMLFPRYVAPSLGYSLEYINGGKMEGQGVEFTFNIHAVDMRNVKLDIRLNGSHAANKMLELPKFFADDEESDNMEYNGGLAAGHSIAEYNMVEYLGVNEKGMATYRAYYDANIGTFGYQPAEDCKQKGLTNTGNYISNLYLYQKNHPDADIRETETDEYSRAGANFTGRTYLPAIDGGLGFDLEVYGVTLSAMLSYRIGGWGYDGQYATLMGSGKAGQHNWHVDMRGAWTEETADAVAALPVEKQIPRLSNGEDLYANSSSTRFMVTNSFLSLNNVRLGYKFPKKLIEKIKLNSLEIWTAGDNLAILSARRGYNPMASYAGSSSEYQYTPLSTVMGGVKFQF